MLRMAVDGHDLLPAARIAGLISTYMRTLRFSGGVAPADACFAEDADAALLAQRPLLLVAGDHQRLAGGKHGFRADGALVDDREAVVVEAHQISLGDGEAQMQVSGVRSVAAGRR